MTVPSPRDREIEKAAKEIAMWHGQKIVVIKPGEGAFTVAALAGFGKWGNASYEYAEAHWRQYISVAEWHLRALAGARAEGMEAAAKVAQAKREEWMAEPGFDMNRTSAIGAATLIEDAIRALAQEPGE